MKHFILIFSLIFLFSNCKSDDVNSNNSMTVSGAWKIKSYIDNNSRDRTSNYSGYSFDFKTTGEITISNSSNKFTGSYATIMDSGKQKFNIILATSNNELAELSEDWILAEKTDSTLRLTKSSGGNGGTKTLIFGK